MPEEHTSVLRRSSLPAYKYVHVSATLSYELVNRLVDRRCITALLGGESLRDLLSHAT